MKRLFLLDAYALIFRAYYALIKMPRITQAGFNTSAIFGFVNTLEELLRKEKPTHLAVCFDPQGPTFRNEEFEGYKADRASTPEDIKLSVPIIKEIVRAYNIPIIEVEGYEADDVIGTIAKMAEKENFTTYMMTPDKDFGQLVSPNILQYKPSYRGQDFELRGENEVCTRYGIEKTSQVIDLLALMGDKIDNIPGCPGIGEVTAVKLISKFGSVENLLENTDQLKGAQKKKIEDNADLIRLSKHLATIRTDVPVEVTPDSLVCAPPDRDKLFAIFRDLEFKSLADRVERRLNGTSSETAKQAAAASKSDNKEPKAASPSLFGEEDFSAAAPEPIVIKRENFDNNKYHIVADASELEELDRHTQAIDLCGLQLIADGENDATCRWIGTAVATAPGEAWYIPSDLPEGVAFILDLMARADIEKVSADSKRAMVIAARRRTDSAPALQNFYDISLAHYVIQPEMRHSIDSLAQTYLNIETEPFPGKTVSARRGTKNLFSADSDDEPIGLWTCQQADMALRLRGPIESQVREEGMESLLQDIEIPLVPVLADMELTGIRIDTKALGEAKISVESRIENLQKEIWQMAGTEFNVGSPAKVGEILFDKLQLDQKAKKTKTGQYSTSEDILEKIAHKHPIVGKIMEYRALRKLLSTYILALPAAINPATGRVHTNYNQTVTATGRISSSAPNLQNIPIRDDEGREIRRAFISEPGCLFLSADYSQIELRLLADFSHDPIMTDAFTHGKDIHAITASKIYHKEQGDVTPNERRNAKTANFGIVYGISPFGLASRLSIPRAEAKEIIDNYFLTFPTVKKYMSDSVEHARELGYVETKMGRKRMLPDINSKNPTVRGFAERNAINAPLQGTAADVIKLAMINIYAEMKKLNLKSKMIMQVHDELNFNVVESELGVLQEIVEREMENAWHGNVRLTASAGVATNWLDAH
ncbi:MAG: DNA polymerase I [Muribaculaceae bacterium]|nr:DNA polymerase I [Muribaculaceae bacterium]